MRFPASLHYKLTDVSSLARQPRQLRNIHRDPPRLVMRKQLRCGAPLLQNRRTRVADRYDRDDEAVCSSTNQGGRNRRSVILAQRSSRARTSSPSHHDPGEPDPDRKIPAEELTNEMSAGVIVSALQYLTFVGA
jgi:hypothetical protein